MKKSVFLLVALIWGSQVFAQTYKSCMEYDPHRTLAEFKDLVMTSKDPFMRKVLWPEYARLVNNILKTSSIEGVNTFVVTPDSAGMQWLMDHTVEYENSYYNQEDYFNGVKVGDRLEYHKVAGHKSNWATTKVGDIIPKDGMYAKIACSNSEKPDFELKKQVVSPQIPNPTSTSSSGSSPDLSKDIPKDIGSMARANPEDKKSPDLNLTPEEEVPSWWDNNKWWVKTGGVLLTTFATGFIAHDNNHSWYFWFPKGGPGGADLVDGRNGGNGK